MSFKKKRTGCTIFTLLESSSSDLPLEKQEISLVNIEKECNTKEHHRSSSSSESEEDMQDNASLAIDPVTRKAFDDMYAITAEKPEELEAKIDYTCETYIQQPRNTVE